jgi:hypothetical protein
VGKRKSRVIAGRLEELGFLTFIVERRFDEHMQPDPITEPLLALAGFDSPVPRRHLGGERFLRVVDAGLGAGAREYLDIVLHTFPSQIDPADEFNVAPSKQEGLPERYAVEVERLMAEKGASRGEAECGLAEIAGITVAAAFVGATAAALILGDVLRALHGGAELAVVSVDLRTPEHVDTAENTTFHEPTNPGSTPAAAPVLGAW